MSVRRDTLKEVFMKSEGSEFASAISDNTSPALIASVPDAGIAQGQRASLDARMMRRMLEAMGQPPFRVSLWNGEEISFCDTPSQPRVLIRDRATLLLLLVDPAFRFGDAYAAGDIEVEGSLTQFIEAVYRAEAKMRSLGFIDHHRFSLLSRLRRNTLTRSRDNVQHHYDLGNAFYELWLDRRMLYTCAYFPTPDAGLEQAQVAKMDLVCRKLRLHPGETVVEAGCGWGAMARHMARHYGVKVRAFNISREQIEYARQRACAEGLDSRVEYVEDDYRNIDGRYDAFVSIGMLEHVGRDHYGELGNVIRRCLPEHGRGLIHTIGRNKPAPMQPWIERRIFPGAYPPTLREMMEVFEPQGFSVLDVENLRLHYARTLEHWLARFEQASERIRQMFDERFVRMWRLYLAGSAAAFNTGDMQLFQILFACPDNNDVPLTRDHLHVGA
ncbi:MAG: cyclopropane fatty acid synthase [Proteobacteria bacterium]|nr:cyclopropane fatty acid synthase [Pseudomonadota bacterium]